MVQNQANSTIVASPSSGPTLHLQPFVPGLLLLLLCVYPPFP